MNNFAETTAPTYSHFLKGRQLEIVNFPHRRQIGSFWSCQTDAITHERNPILQILLTMAYLKSTLFLSFIKTNHCLTALLILLCGTNVWAGEKDPAAAFPGDPEAAQRAAAHNTYGAGSHDEYPHAPIPPRLSEYEAYEKEHGITGLVDILKHRISATPFNLLASLLFLGAIIHTFMAGYFRKLAHDLQHAHEHHITHKGGKAEHKPYTDAKDDTSFRAEICHFLGEIEAIFGIWLVPLMLAITVFYGWHGVTGYFDFLSDNHKYTEPLFVIVIMAIASTRPVLKFSEAFLRLFANLGKNTPAAWWFAILTVAPLLGSFITEPAAMTIAALLLAKLIYRHDPSTRFKYATLGLLFVNVSVGGTLTHFAAPPVLMVANVWGWDMPFMFTNFGWKAIVGILVANGVVGYLFRQELVALREKVRHDADYGSSKNEQPVPLWVTILVLFFMLWTVLNLHHPPLFMGGFLFFLAFSAATKTHHDEMRIQGPLLVGFFLAGLVTHGALQQWWIAPVLGSMGEFALFVGATTLTAFNDNAAITFLASQVPSFDWHIAEDVVKARALEYAVVAGAVTGGGLTVIANAPNPAGQNILQKFFGSNGISPVSLFLAALFPTFVMALAFLLL